MPQFSQKSIDILNTCDPNLVKLFTEVVKIVDCTVICGHRGQKDQDQAFAEGRSKLKWPNGQHNKLPSRAVDVAPYYPDTKIRWNDAKGFIHFAGIVRGVAAGLGIKVRWGGDWDGDFDLLDNSFNDLPHFELVD